MGYWNFSGGYGIPSIQKNYNFTNAYNLVLSPGSGRTTDLWGDAYTNLKNYNFMDTRGGQLGQPYIQGVAKIMKAFTFEYLVDTFGNVPYSQALQGTTVITPKYDDAQAVYDSLFLQINAGMALLTKTEGTLNPGPNDIMFQGDAAKWLRFANTLKLRMLLRQSEKADRAAYVQTQLAAIKASGFGFLGVGENAAINPGYANSNNQQNPFYGTFGFGVNSKPIEANNYYKGNGYAISFYQQSKDPRLGAYYAPVPTTTTYAGTLFGTVDTQPNSAVSGIGPGLLQSVSQSAVVLASHESLFMQAEAAQRGWITGDPKTLYQSAISESFVNVGRTAAEATAYYSQAGINDVNWDASPNKIEAIITQKWASENGADPFEAWSDYRRLGLPATIPISQDPTVTTRQIPARLFYPQSEQSNNAANVGAQGEYQPVYEQNFLDEVRVSQNKQTTMKNIVKIVVAASLAVSLTSCLKDDEHYVDIQGSGYIAEIPYAANRSVIRTTDSLIRTSATAYVFPVDVNIASPNPPDTNIPITVALDQAALTAYNTANKTTYQLLPSTAYQLTNPSVMVAAGSRIATVNISIVPNQVPTTGSYVIPVSITTVPANVTISASYHTQLLRVLLKK